MYLENIFIGSEDIRKQLPQESLMFDAVHTTFMKYMKMLTVTNNCLKATTSSGMLDTFQVGNIWDQRTPCKKLTTSYQSSVKNHIFA